MIRPRALHPGDQIRVVSPASPLTPDKVERGVALLEAQGYRVTFGRHAFSTHGYLAGTDAQRAADLMEAFLDHDVRGIVCSRGGYGCARLFPYLDLDSAARAGKVFVGFSDVTTLHTALNRRGLVTFHAPMLISLGRDRETWVIESFLRALRGQDPLDVRYGPATCVVPGAAEGLATGGCMCLVGDAIGTPEAPHFKGKVVLLEDVNEKPYRVDALLTSFLNAGLLQDAAGIAVGEMTCTDEKRDDPATEPTWRDIVRERLAGLGVPVMIDFPIGHAEQMLSVPLGVRVRMDAEAGTLRLLEPSCVAS